MTGVFRGSRARNLSWPKRSKKYERASRTASRSIRPQPPWGVPPRRSSSLPRSVGCCAAAARRRSGLDLTETEFLALDLVARNESQTVRATSQARRGAAGPDVADPAEPGAPQRQAADQVRDQPDRPSPDRRDDYRCGPQGAPLLPRRPHLQNAETLSQLPLPDVREFMRIMEKIRTSMLPRLQTEERR